MARALTALIVAVACGACAFVEAAREEPGLELAIEGNTTFTYAELWRAIRDTVEGFETSSSQKSLIDDAAFELERFYLSEGFPFVRVQYVFDGAEEGSDAEEQEDESAESDTAKPRGSKQAKAVLTVDEGPRVVLTRISFHGNATVRGSVLAPFFQSPESGLPALDGKGWFVQDRIESGVDRLEGYYFDRGYQDAYVAAPEFRFSPDRATATLDIWVREGIQHLIGTVEITGDLPFDPMELRSVYASYLAKPYFERISPEIQGRIEEYYADRGYADVIVTRTKRETDPEGRVTLAFEVDAGPLVRVGKVRIQGNTKTRSKFIRSRLELEPGDPFDRSKERTSFARLFQTGLFENVKLSLAKDQSDVRDLEIEVVEAQSLEVFLEPGWGSYEQLRLGGGARNKNLFGTGKILQADGSLSNLDQHGKLSLIDPWFLGSDVAADLSLFGRSRQEPGFHTRELGSGLQLTKRVSQRVEIGTNYTYRQSDISDVDGSAPLPSDVVDDVDISSVGASATYDSRDVVYAPTRGSLSKVSFEFAAAPLGSELEFVRLTATQSNFFPFNPETLLGVSFRSGWMAPIGETDTIPLQERYFNGGESTVRSFQEDELGPKDTDGNPLGGEAFTVFSVELRRKLIGHFHVAVFCDLGNVVPDHSDYFDFSDFRAGIGAGLRYELPVGPIRLDGAINPDPRSDEDSGALHFSVGMAF